MGVNWHYATDQGSLPWDFELYLPEEWTNDPARCARAGVPEETTFKTKWELGVTMLDRALECGLTNGLQLIANADAGYGKRCEFRDALTKRGLIYIVGVDANTGVWVPPVPVTPVARKRNRGRIPSRFDYGEQEPPSVLEVAKALPDSALQEVTWVDRECNPLRSRFAAIRVHPSKGYNEGQSVTPGGMATH